jgi:hypothetical protein
MTFHKIASSNNLSCWKVGKVLQKHGGGIILTILSKLPAHTNSGATVKWSAANDLMKSLRCTKLFPIGKFRFQLESFGFQLESFGFQLETVFCKKKSNWKVVVFPIGNRFTKKFQIGKFRKNGKTNVSNWKPFGKNNNIYNNIILSLLLIDKRDKK